MIGKIKGWLAAAGLVLAALFIAFWRGRRAGIDHIEAEQQKRRLKAMQDRKAVDDEVSQMGSNDVDQRLNGWMRDDR
jgi:hypothetical protein